MSIFIGVLLIAWTVAIILLYAFFAGLAVEKFEKIEKK